MSTSGDQAVYRVRTFHRKGDLPKKYRHTLEVTDDRTRQVRATGDLIGRATFATLTITDQEDRAWQMRPNRKVMPSRWIVTDPEQHIAMQFDQKILGKLVNPLYRVALGLLDGAGNEVYRLVDTRTSIPDRILDISPDEWALMADERPVAKLVRLPRETVEASGLMGKARRFLAGSDEGIVSAGAEHALPAPVALGMLMILKEVRDPSAG